MAAVDAGTAQVLGAAVTGISLVIVAWLQVKNNRHLRVINRSVNHIAEGEPTLIDRVRYAEQCQEWSTTALSQIAHQVGVGLPPVPERTRSNA